MRNTGRSRNQRHEVRYRIFAVSLLLILSACTYLQNTIKQASYARLQETDPSQHTLKHMIERDTFLVYGRIVDTTTQFRDRAISVAAYCSRFQNNELVDIAHVAKIGTHFGLNLPEGEYDIVVFADRDQNQLFDQSEVVAQHAIELSSAALPGRVVDHGDIQIAHQDPVSWPINIPVPTAIPTQESVFFPKGTIRQLSDPLFDSAMASLGLYEPAAFMEQGPTMFYSLEEDSYKIPVIFVHGIGGSAREFEAIVSRLDLQRYQPWFFYYPSGNDLDQLADLFYDIFLSGKVIDRGETPVAIVAHSMGGLVVREALNKYRHSASENRIGLFISLASPFGGHPAATAGVDRAPMVIPSWRDLDSRSLFIQRLFRRSLKGTIEHDLFYAKGDHTMQQNGADSDGTVPLASQRRQEAVMQTTVQMGFNTTHTGILEDDETLRAIFKSLNRVKNAYPESHLKVLALGGYDVMLGEDYTGKEKYFIQKRGEYLNALATGILATLGSPVLEHFVQAAHGKTTANNEAETAWLKFAEDYPTISTPSIIRPE